MHSTPRVIYLVKKLAEGKGMDKLVPISADTSVMIRPDGANKRIIVFYRKDMVFRGVSLPDDGWACGLAKDGPWEAELEEAFSKG